LDEFSVFDKGKGLAYHINSKQWITFRAISNELPHDKFVCWKGLNNSKNTCAMTSLYPHSHNFSRDGLYGYIYIYHKMKKTNFQYFGGIRLREPGMLNYSDDRTVF